MRCQLLTPSTKSNVITLSTEEAGLKFSIAAMVSQILHNQAGTNMHILELASSAKISSLLLGSAGLPILLYRRLINYFDFQNTGINRAERALSMLKESIANGTNEGVIQAQKFSVLSSFRFDCK